MKKYLALALCVLLAGCAVTYSAPATGPRAKLRVIAKNSDGYFVHTRDLTQTCSPSSPNLPPLGGDTAADPERIGIPESIGPKSDRFERYVVANTPVTLTATTMYRVGFGQAVASVVTVVGQAQYRASAWSCNTKVRFVPVEGAQYEMVYDFAPNKCDVYVNSLEIENGVTIRKPVQISTLPPTC
ncbi:MAG: hypothetical protein QM776_03650 [Rhodocyclaceae bacterium]